MKIVSAAGKKSIKMARKEWESIGKKAGWMKQSSINHAQLDSYIKTIMEKGESLGHNGNPYPYVCGHLQSIIEGLLSDLDRVLNGSTFVGYASKAIGAEDIMNRIIELVEEKSNRVIVDENI